MQSFFDSASSSRAAIALALLVMACGGRSGGADAAPVDPADATDGLAVDLPPRPCTLVLPTCPATGAPSYVRDVQPIIARRCLPACHGPGGIEAQAQPLSTYAQIFQRRANILSQVYSCKMPPLDQPALADEDAAVILTWLVCASPNN
jgi:hypothetical protein